MRPPEALHLGQAELDDDHDGLFRHLALLEACSDAELPASLAVFALELDRHFEREDRLMAEGDFATRDCHLDEHAAVLASIAEVQVLVDRGEVVVARRLTRELRRWLPEHIEALDHALSQWLFRCKTGGVRLVMRARQAVAANA
jgi:hemerythrin-like metal-binding protein